MREFAEANGQSFAWQIIRWHAVNQWQRGKYVFSLLLIAPMFHSGFRPEFVAFIAAFYLLGVLFAAGLSSLLWITAGRIVTTRHEREALTAKEQVALAVSYDIWWRPARKSRT